MRRGLWLLAPAIAASSAAAAQPADRTPATSALATLPAETMCNIDGAIGYKFGATNGPPQLFMPGMTSLRLAPRFAPFERAGIDSTMWSNRIYQATYVMQLPGKEAALAAIQQLAARFQELGWTADRGVSDEDAAARSLFLTYRAPGAGEVHLYWPAGTVGADRKDGVRVQLTQLAGEVTLSCISIPLFLDHVNEALGNLPPGTPKPVEPSLPLPKEVDVSTCADQAKRDAFLATRPEDNALMRHTMERAKFRERLVTWKLDRLKKSGKLSREEVTKLLFSGLSDPKAQSGMAAGLGLIGGMMDDVEQVMRAEKGKDDVAACRALIGMTARFEKIGPAVDPQWKAIEAAIDKEAVRLGVSLD